MKLSNVMTTFFLLLLSSGVALGAQISPESVTPASVKMFQHEGQSATVSHRVPDRFLGTYEFKGNTSLTIHFDSDGSGYLIPSGQSRRDFNWGMLVQNNRLVVTSYTNYSTNNTGSWDAHLVIIKWDDGSYHPTYIFDYKGQLASPAGYGNMMTRQ